MSDYTKERGVSFGYRTENGNVRGERHSFRDFGLYPKDAPELEAPEVNTSGIYVPGADGVIDTTDVMDGTAHYKNRKAVFTFFLAGPRDRWVEVYHRLLRELHGRRRDILPDGDAGGYYTGRLTVDKPKVDGLSHMAHFTVRGDLQPFQYDFTTTGESWLWGPFRFARDCYRRNYGTIRVPAKLTDDYAAVTAVTEYAAVTAAEGDNPAEKGWYERTGAAPDYVYTLTEDAAPVDGKTYWEYAGDKPKESGWYERTGAAPDYVYTLTEDETPVEGKTYFAAAGRMVIHPYARIEEGEVIFPLRTSDLPASPEITVTRQTDHVTGVRVRYVNVHRAAKDVTISSATPADSHPFSDLILCTQRAEVTEVKLSAVTSAGADGKDFAEIKIDYRTGRL